MFENLLRCPNCGSGIGCPLWRARKTVLWSNQSGWEYRVFCDECQETSDVKLLMREQNIPPTAVSFSMSYRQMPSHTHIKRYDAMIGHYTKEFADIPF